MSRHSTSSDLCSQRGSDALIWADGPNAAVCRRHSSFGGLVDRPGVRSPIKITRVT